MKADGADSETETTGEEPPEATPERAESAGEQSEAAAEQSGATAGQAEALGYESAVKRLEEIIDRLDSGRAGLRETLDLCREGRDLVSFCAKELEEVGEDLKELKLDELVAALEPPTEP